MAIFFAILTMAGWAAGDIFATMSARILGSRPSYFWAMVFAFLFSCLYIPFAGVILDWRFFVFSFLLNIFHIGANLAFLKGLEKGNAAIVGTLTGSSTVLTVLISLVLFGESLSVLQSLGIFFIFAGAVLVSFKNEGKKSEFKNLFSDPGIPYALVAMAGYGIYFALVRITAENIGFFWANIPIYLLTFVAFLLMKDKKAKSPEIFANRKGLIVTILFALLWATGDFSYNLGILRGFTSIVAPIAGAYPVLFVILARFFFKEKLTLRQKMGILITLGGIIAVGIT